MPTTPGGVVATPAYASEGVGSYQRRWYMDDTKKGNTAIPTVLFCHGSGGSVDSLDHFSWVSFRNAALGAGWAIIEADGGGPNNWGGPAAQALYVDAFTWVDGLIDVGPLFIMGQSMGAIGAYNLATQPPLAARHSGLVIQNGTTDLTARYDDLVRGGFTQMNAAYGVPGTTYQPDEFALAAAAYDPMQFDPALWAGKNVRQVWGTNDTSVEPAVHGMAWVVEYGTATAYTEVDESTADHTPTQPQGTRTWSFMQAHLPAPEPEPGPPPTRVYKIAEIRRL